MFDSSGGKFHLSDSAMSRALRDPKIKKYDGSFIPPRMNTGEWRRALADWEKADSMLYYVIKLPAMNEDDVVVLDQALMEVAVDTLHPDVGDDFNRIIAFNLLERYGHDADTNHDGTVDETEMKALRKLLGLSSSYDAETGKAGKLDLCRVIAMRH